MTGYDESLVKCSSDKCEKQMLVTHYGFHPTFTIFCPEHTDNLKTIFSPNKLQKLTEVAEQ